MAKKNMRSLVVISFRTFGDYVLKAGLIKGVREKYPAHEITILTNQKGALTYPLIDSRAEVIRLDKDTPLIAIIKLLIGLGKVDETIVADDSRTSLLLGLLIRSRHKRGWYQNSSQLYGPSGWYAYRSVPRWLSALVRLQFGTALLREPEKKYEAHVELELIEIISTSPLAAFRTENTFKGIRPVAQPYLYISCLAGWDARQLSGALWVNLFPALCNLFPAHLILVHGSDEIVTGMANPRVVTVTGIGIPDLFSTISHADLVIAPDSFALHIAALYDVPTIGYFGPAKPHRFRPIGTKHFAIFHDPGCSPCLQERGSTNCARGFSQCVALSEITVDDFLAAARDLLIVQDLKRL